MPQIAQHGKAVGMKVGSVQATGGLPGCTRTPEANHVHGI